MAIVDGGIAADNLTGFDITGDAALGGGYGSVAYGAVACDAHLTGKNDSLAYGSGTSDANLCTEESVLAYGRTVPYLNEVVDFSSCVNPGLADGGAVDTGVGLDLDGIFEDCGAGLEDLVPRAVGLAGEAEAVGTNDGSVLKDDVVAKLAVLANYRVGVGEEIFSSLGVRVEDYVREENGVDSNGYVVRDDDVGSDVSVGSDFCCGGNDGGGVDARGIGGRLVEQFDGVSEGKVGVTDAEGGRGDFGEAGLDEDCSRFGGAGLRGVFGVGYEGEVARGGVVDGGYSGDVSGGVAHESGSQVLG